MVRISGNTYVSPPFGVDMYGKQLVFSDIVSNNTTYVTVIDVTGAGVGWFGVQGIGGAGGGYWVQVKVTVDGVVVANGVNYLYATSSAGINEVQPMMLKFQSSFKVEMKAASGTISGYYTAGVAYA